MIEALLLDFDGLLYDTESASFGAWEEIYAQHGVQLPVALWVAEVMGRAPGSSAFDPVEHLREITGVEIDRDRLLVLREIRRRETLEVVAAEAVAFEDSPNGVAAAKAAGLACVAVPNVLTRGAAGLERGDLTVGSLAEVSLDDLPPGAPAPAADHW